MDRVIRTIRNLFKQQFTIQGNFDWLNIMYKIENNYNNSIHKTLKETPNDIFYGKVKLENTPKRDVEKLNVGDKVRISICKDLFNQKYLTNWSKEIYTISEIVGVGYVLETLDGKELHRKFFIRELLYIPNNTRQNKKTEITDKDLRKQNLITNRLDKVRINLN